MAAPQFTPGSGAHATHAALTGRPHPDDRLDQHDAVLGAHADMLADHGDRLDNHHDRLAKLEGHAEPDADEDTTTDSGS